MSTLKVNSIEARTGSEVDINSSLGTIPSLTISGVTTVSAGSASAPAITPSGDPNTGIFFPDADNIAFAEGGTEVLRINSSAFVGIGTTNPTAQLAVDQGTSDGTIFDLKNEEVRLNIAILGSGSVFPRTATINSTRVDGGTFPKLRVGGQGGIEFAVDLNTVRATIDSSGNLGIGTTNPAVKTHISDSVSSTGATGTEILRIANTRVNTGSGAVALRFVNNEISGTNQYTRAQIAAEYDGSSDNNGRLMFATANTSGNLIERARIDGSGRLGINTTTPTNLLDVRSFSGAAAFFELNSGATNNATNSALTISGRTTGSRANGFAAGLTFQHQDNSGAYAGCQIASVPNADLNTANLTLRSRNYGYVDVLTATSDSRIGIGTTNPSAKLDLRGNLYFADEPDEYAFAIRSFTNGHVVANRGKKVRLGMSDGSFAGMEVKTFQGPQVSGNYNAQDVIVYTHNGGLAGDIVTFVARHTGECGIGSTTPTGKLDVAVTSKTNIRLTNSAENAILSFRSNGLSDTAKITASEDSGGGVLLFNTKTTGGVDTERAKITSGGLLKVTNGSQPSRYTNTANHAICSDTGSQFALAIVNTNASTPFGLTIDYNSVAPNGTGNAFVECADTGGTRFNVRSNGGVANYSANNVNLASDIRLKKDVTPLSTTWEKVKDIEVVNFRYKDCNEGDPLLYGVIAQQVQEIVPELVVVTSEATEEKPEYYGIREQPMYWLAIKALQEAQLRIEELEAKVAALEGS